MMSISYGTASSAKTGEPVDPISAHFQHNSDSLLTTRYIPA